MEERTIFLIAIPAFTIFVIFQNHYCRDTLGALEQQIENDLPLDPSQYSMLNSLYFVPNIIAPLFTGTLCELSGRPANFLLYCAIFGTLGHLIFALGSDTTNISWMYTGRFMAGTVYEIIDTVPIIMMGPLFKGSWGFIVGIMNGCLRLGSVFTFCFSPMIYRYILLPIGAMHISRSEAFHAVDKRNLR